MTKASIAITALAVAVYFIAIWFTPSVYRAYIIFSFGLIAGFMLCKYVWSNVQQKGKKVIKDK